MALTLAQLQAKRDEILLDIETASVTFADGRSKTFITDKRESLRLLDVQIAALGAATTRCTYASFNKG